MVDFTQSETAKGFRGEILNIKGDDRCASRGRAAASLKPLSTYITDGRLYTFLGKAPHLTVNLFSLDYWINLRKNSSSTAKIFLTVNRS